MSDVLLFHHAQGRTPGVLAFADRLREAGHTVHTPDLFDGRLFDSIEAGMAHVEELGMDNVIERGTAAAQSLPEQLFYVGFSLGVVPAQKLAQTRDGARGAVLATRACRASSSGRGRTACRCRSTAWTPTRSSSAKVTSTPLARSSTPPTWTAELFLYPGDQHYFADSSLPSYDPEATALLTQRVLAFLAA